MRVIETVSEFRNWRRQPEAGRSVGFVPTMGALHNGHLSLFRQAKKECDSTVASIFINPTQFNDPKDLEKYPRMLEHDLYMTESAGIDVVFIPSASEIYADQYRFQITESKLSQILCGALRPGHFSGVLTVVAKLFHIVEPTRSYFGEKDYQQFLLIREMAQALFLPVEVIGLPIVREADGLAMSSRNMRLTPEQRRIAPILHRELASGRPLTEVRNALEQAGFRVDYLEEHFGRKFAAAFLGEVRLIDNV